MKVASFTNTNSDKEYRRSKIYVIVMFGGTEAEFCTDGNIRIAIWQNEVRENKYANMPSQEELDLFYVKEGYVYVPVLFNARLK